MLLYKRLFFASLIMIFPIRSAFASVIELMCFSSKDGYEKITIDTAAPSIDFKGNENNFIQDGAICGLFGCISADDNVRDRYYVDIDESNVRYGTIDYGKYCQGDPSRKTANGYTCFFELGHIDRRTLVYYHGSSGFSQ